MEKEHEIKTETKATNKWTILITVLIATFMATLDASVVNVALPKMATALNVTTSSIQLVVSIYIITIAAMVLIFGKLGDMYGKSKMFKVGVTLFTLGSLLCGISQSFPVLIISRIIQGIGAAGTMANNQGIITQVFNSNERGKALGFLGTAVALGALVGPGLGGLIVGIVSWEFIFLINVPIGIAAIYFANKLLPSKKKTTDEKIDYFGAILFIFSIVPLFMALEQSLIYGIANPFIISGFAISLISFILFLRIEKKKPLPLLDLSIFKNKIFSLSILCAFIIFSAMFSYSIVFPFYIQNVLNYTPLHAGLILMINPLILFMMSPVSGIISDKIGSEVLTFIGMILVSVGLFLISTLTDVSTIIQIILYIIVMSLGVALFQAPNNSLIMSTVPKNKLGIAGSINALIRNVGMSSGIAMSSMILYGVMSSKLGYKVTDFVVGRSDVFVSGMQTVYITAGIVSLLGAILTLTRIFGKNRITEGRLNL